MGLITLSGSYAQRNYNLLWSIEDVDAALNSDSLNRFLGEVGDLFREYEVPVLFGVCLLHKHYNLEDDEYPVEFFERLVQGPALVTKAVTSLPQGGVQANRWKVMENGIEPMEFSTSSCLPLGVDTELKSISSNFFISLYCLLKEHEYDGLIGFCVVERPFYSARSHDEVALEASDSSEKANIVTIEPRSSVDGGKYIETSWQFPWHEVQAAVMCPRVCKSYCLNILSHSPGHYNIHSAAA